MINTKNLIADGWEYRPALGIWIKSYHGVLLQMDHHYLHTSKAKVSFTYPESGYIMPMEVASLEEIYPIVDNVLNGDVSKLEAIDLS